MRQRHAARTTLAWTIAKLSRAKDIPALDDLLARFDRNPADASAEMQAAMAVYRQVAEKRGKIKRWKEWLH